MKKILLTSSQVSVLVTSAIVALCTFALFFSGYVIQQRTLTELRSSIRPRQSRPSPMVYLPEQFKTTSQLEDETQKISWESNEEAKDSENSFINVAPTVPQTDDGGTVSGAKMAMLEEIKAKASKQAWAVEHPDPLAKNKVPVTRAERRRLIKEEISRLSQGNERVYWQRRLW